MSRFKLGLVTIVVFFAVIIFSPSGLTPNPIVAATPNSPYAGVGGLLDVYEYAKNDSSTTIRNGINDTTFTYLGSWFPQTPTVYRGYQLHAEITNLFEIRNPVPNGEFNQTEPGTTWVESLNSRGIVEDWGTTPSAGNPAPCLDINLDDRWEDKAAEARFDNTFTYTSDKQPYNSTLEFDINYSSMMTRKKELQIRVALIYHTTEIGGWSETTDIYSPTSWDHLSFSTAPINGSATLRIFIIYSGGKPNWLTGHVYFDNFRYRILTQRSPTEVALTLNNTAFVNTGNNNGEVDLYADPANKAEANLTNCWSATQVFQFNSPYNLKFYYHYSMFVKSEKVDAALTHFTAPVDANPTWEISYTTPSSLPPSFHSGYTFGLFLQTGWALSSVENDTGDVISDYQFNASSRFIIIDEGVPGPDEDFLIFASSMNYVESISPQISATGTGGWATQSIDDYYVKGDYLRVVAELQAWNPVDNDGEVSIFFPNDTLWQTDTNPTIYSNGTLISQVWLIPTIDASAAGSDWLVTVSYNSSSQCGMRERSIAIVIETTATKVTPSDGKRVISGSTVTVEVQWQNLDTSDYIIDAIARIQYYDRNMQLQTVGMTGDGMGGYSTELSTNLIQPSLTATFSVELFRYGYVNASSDEGSQVDFTINLVNDIRYDMVKPTQQTGTDEFTAETSKSQGYTSLVKFYDRFQSAYVLNETSLWPTVLVQYVYYEDTGSGFGSPLASGSFSQNVTTRLFYKEDAVFGDVQRVKYEVTMQIIGASWEFEQQNFTIIINVVSWATDLDAVRTSITYPPTGTGDGWTEYNNVTDSYQAHVYWDETFNINVYYENISALPPHGIASATVNILIDISTYPMTDLGSGYYSYTFDTNSFSVDVVDLYVTATYTDHAAQTIRIQVYIDARVTQLTSSYSPTTAQFPYGGDFSVTFTFTDVVSISDPIDWATPTISGYVIGKYSIMNNGGGTYTVTFQGDVTETTYYVTILFNESNYVSKSKYYELTVRPIHTATWASTDNPSVPWGTAVVITLKYNDSDNGYIGISGALITFSWMDSISGVDFWLTDNGDGTYTIILNTSKVAAGTQGYTISFTLSKTHYDSDQIDATFQVRDIQTTLFIVDTKVMGQTTTSIPWGETLTLILHYNDTENELHIPSASISCNWDSHYWNAYYNATDHAYYLTIYTDNAIEGSYTIQIYAAKSHYINGFNIQSFVIRKIQTTLTALPSYIASSPWGDNLTIRLTYQDLDHGGIYIPYATTITDWDVGYFTFYDFGNGTYLLLLNTTNRVIGQHAVQITLSESLLSPHFAERTITILLTLDPIPIIIHIISPPGGQNITWYNDMQILTVNVTDHLGHPINTGITVYEWASRPNVTMTFLGNGIWTATFLADAEPGSWIVTIVANNPPNYRIGSASIALIIQETTTQLDPLTLLPISPIANTSFTFLVNFTTTNGQPIEGATVTYSFGPHNGVFIDETQGVYNATISSAGMGAGQFTLYISASKATMQTQWIQVTVFLTLIPCNLDPEVPVLNVDWGENFTVNAYFYNISGSPISGANIIFNWFNQSGSLIPNGTIGWYTITLSSTLSTADSFYTLTLTVNHPSHEYRIAIVTVNILRQDTDLVLIQAEAHYQTIIRILNTTPWELPWGDTLVLYFSYTDRNGLSISNATGVYNWGFGSGTLEYIGGLYVASIDLAGITPASYELMVTISKQNYEPRRSSSFELVVSKFQTEITILEGATSVMAGAPFHLVLYISDSFHQLPVTHANVSISCESLFIPNLPFENHNNGNYSIYLTISQPGTHEFIVHVEVDDRFDINNEPITFLAETNPVVQNFINIGAIIAVLGIIILTTWLAYVRVFSIPWMVRKMRKMAQTISRGHTPTLSKSEIGRITNRPDLMQDIAEPAYRTVGLTAGSVVIPAEIDWREREAEEEAIWSQLKGLPFIEYEQKLELFQQMKQIAPSERVWFIEDLKKQMGDGTRFARKLKEPEIAEDLETLLHARLALFPALSDTEKTRIAAQLRKIPKEDWNEIFDTLAISQAPQTVEVPEPLRPDELPSLTKEEREKLMDEIKDLTEEERQKVLRTIRDKRDADAPKGKRIKGKTDFVIDDKEKKKQT
ncbi:MAG: collagen binding domain-containing protein [Promethearchaeota archaeon]